MPQVGTQPVPAPVAGTPVMERVLERLASLQRPDGGWPFEPAQETSFTEPTCWSSMALHASGRLTPVVSSAACSFLRSVQLPDGGFHSGAANREANWCTSLATFALLTLGAEPEAAKRGLDWLLAFEGWHDMTPNPAVFGHDVTIHGWPWVAGSHSWIEPTSYAIYALRAAGLGSHPRVTEGVRMILDRALPAGGWNYGNTRVLGTELRAFPSTTGMALLALPDEQPGPEAQRGLRFLGTVWPHLRTGWALAWTTFAGWRYGFDAFETPEPIDIRQRLGECADRMLRPESRLRVHELAVLALSSCGADRLPFPHAASEAASSREL